MLGYSDQNLVCYYQVTLIELQLKRIGLLLFLFVFKTISSLIIQLNEKELIIFSSVFLTTDAICCTKKLMIVLIHVLLLFMISFTVPIL